jgi:hypothetical protein
LQQRGIRPTVAIDALTAEQYPDLLDHLKALDCEFVAHGLCGHAAIRPAR